MKRAWLIVFIGVVILTGFVSATSAQTPKRGGTLTIGFKEEPDRLDARYPGRRFLLFPRLLIFFICARE